VKAMVFEGESGVRYRAVDDPTLRDHSSAIVKVTHCSICGSDSQFYHGINNASTDTGFCVGHETIGEVVELGRHVDQVKHGDQVMLSGLTSKACGVCANCKAGKPFYCHRLQLGIYGNSCALHGGQAEAILVPDAKANATLIPEGISAEQALLLTDTLATAYFGCEKAEIQPGGAVAVVGLGPIGLMAVELAFVFGASQVFAIDPVDYRREQARTLGAVPLKPEEAAQEMTEATDAAMADSIIDAAGRESSIQLSAEIASNRGVIACVGISHHPTLQFPHLLAIMKSLTFRSVLSYVPMSWPALIPLLQSGRIRPERVFSHHMPLSEGEQAYTQFFEKQDSTLKVVLNPG